VEGELMSYDALVNRNLARAFALAKDLAVDVQLVKSGPVAFDFSSGLPEDAATVEVNTKAVVVSGTTSSDSHKTSAKRIMLKTKDVGALSAYDHLRMNGEVWKISPASRDGTFVTIVEIHKET
jgi:hypothetical protein